MGVKVADKVCVPIDSTVPLGGVYAKLPATFADAFSCVASSGVPATIGAGTGHVMIGVAFAVGVISTAAKFHS